MRLSKSYRFDVCRITHVMVTWKSVRKHGRLILHKNLQALQLRRGGWPAKASEAISFGPILEDHGRSHLQHIDRSQPLLPPS